MMMHAQGSHEISVHIYHATWHHIPKDTDLQILLKFIVIVSRHLEYSYIYLFMIIYLTNQQMNYLPTYLTD